ncbi:DIP1984 family protein [Fredinandcohnia quinoae]|uniref:DIP1984 family protein n=1 Tax=Fredinandcohnia quinoae TaxID=2918902 RepID=A0AAW5E3K7_9BACI|nr:DIP1984 family protein [Fredinandcohnia sp. SECRCQ15]MCH1625384.1 DIP1984 family protein [Fredinandcohnia sp. SECRCQ15]
MKLAEALLERADLQKRLAQLKERLLRSTVVQEGEQPAEDPNTLLLEMDNIIKALKILVMRINYTNSTTTLVNYGTISDAITHRELLMKKRSILEAVIEKASIMDMRYSHSEIKTIPTVNVKKLQDQVDDISKQYRLVDTLLQQTNWLTDLK